MQNEDASVTRKQVSFKILIIGDPGTGKTSIIRRFVQNVFTNNYKATIGVDFALKIMTHGPDKLVHLQLWDISGQDRYGVMTRVYYKDAHAALIVMDSTRKGTLEGAVKWKDDLDNKVLLADGSKIPAVLVANKCDVESSLSDEELHHVETEKEFLASFRVSAKENIGIEEAFEKVVEQILSTENSGHYEMPFYNREGRVRLGESESKTKTNRGCCLSS